MWDKLVRDRIVVRVIDAKLGEYLINVDNLVLASCIQKSNQYLTNHEHVKKIEIFGNDNNIEVLGLGKHEGFRLYGAQRNVISRTCFFGNKEPHKKEEYLAKSSVCHECKWKSHWARARSCKSEQKNRKNDEVSQTSEKNLDESAKGLLPKWSMTRRGYNKHRHSEP